MHKKQYLFVAILLTTFLTVISLREADNLPGNIIPQLDKLFHIGAYIVLTFVWSMYVYLSRPKLKAYNVIGFVLGVLSIYGIIIEVLQSRLTATRLFEIYDLLANIIGMVLGALIFSHAIKSKLKNN